MGSLTHLTLIFTWEQMTIMADEFDYDKMEADLQKDYDDTQAEFNKGLRSHLKGKTIKNVRGYYSLSFMGPKEIEITFSDNTGIRFTNEGFELFDKNPVPRYLQAFNPSTERWVKIDSTKGRIVANKSSPGPYKGIPEHEPRCKYKYVAVRGHMRPDGKRVRAHLSMATQRFLTARWAHRPMTRLPVKA